MHKGLFLCLVALGLWGCGGSGWPEVVDTRSLFAGGSPSIGKIRDLGTVIVPELGQFTGEPDGVACPGEGLLIEGSGFGKQPTVTVGGAAAEVLARTSGGGIVVRVPVAIGVGPQPVEVSVEEMHAKKDFPIRRIGLVSHEGKVHALTVEAGRAAVLGAAIAVPGVRAMRVSSEGGIAYLLTHGGRKISLLDLGAAGGPKVIDTRDLEITATGLVVAERAPLVFAVGAGVIQGFETSRPRQPARYEKAQLPEEAKGAKFLALDPAGRRLALIVPDENRLVLVDIGKRTETKLSAQVVLLPEARVPLVRDLAFAADGETLWVISGDNPGSLKMGVQPTRVTGVRIEGDEGAEGGLQVSVWRTFPILGAGAPLKLLVPRAKPLAAGTTIRMPPDKAALYFSSVMPAMIQAADAGAVVELIAGKSPGALDRADMIGGGGHLAEVPFVIGPGEVGPEGALVAAAGRLAPGGREFGFAAALLSDKPGHVVQLEFTRLAPAGNADFAPPFSLGEVRVQP